MTRLYVLENGGKSIRCLVCGGVSWRPKDIEHLFCAHCVRFHRSEVLNADQYRILVAIRDQTGTPEGLTECIHRMLIALCHRGYLVEVKGEVMLTNKAMLAIQVQ